MELKEFRVTFGQRYRRQEHPRLAEAHPDGCVSVMAIHYDAARQVVVDHLGEAWAFLYGGPFDETEWAAHYPVGRLRTLQAAPAAVVMS